MKWNRGDIVTAAFVAGGPGAAYDPIRVQKLLFLVDEEVADRIGGPFFNFQPYDYGPFDQAAYRELEGLENRGEVSVDRSARYPRYLLTESGGRRGNEVLAQFPEPVVTYFGDAARWVRFMPYRRMLAELYRKYPRMAVNSVVRDLRPPRREKAGDPFLRGMARAFDFTGRQDRVADSEAGVGSDRDAIADAWRVVGEEIEEAMIRFGAEERLW